MREPPLIIARVPMTSSPDERAEFAERLRDLGTDSIILPDESYDIQYLIPKPEPGELARAMFRVRMHEEICRRAEVNDCGMPIVVWSSIEAIEAYERVERVMWNETELGVRFECERQAEAIVGAWS